MDLEKLPNLRLRNSNLADVGTYGYGLIYLKFMRALDPSEKFGMKDMVHARFLWMIRDFRNINNKNNK